MVVFASYLGIILPSDFRWFLQNVTKLLDVSFIVYIYLCIGLKQSNFPFNLLKVDMLLTLLNVYPFD